jgi:integrase/recombinase XerD
MRTLNAKNERIKHRYYAWERGARGKSEASIDAIAKAIQRFEEFNNYRDFATFRFEQAESFKAHLFTQANARTGEPLSKSTIHSTCCALKTFFLWLAREPGYRSKLNDTEYFRVSLKDARIATAKRSPRFPTEEQILLALLAMPTETEIQRRDQALFACIYLISARDGAAVSLSLGDIDLEASSVHQDARHVRTKFSKSYTSRFFPVDERFVTIFVSWITYTRMEKNFEPNEPVFPATEMGRGLDNCLGPQGLSRTFWKTTGPARKVFREAFTRVGLPYFNPHSFRHAIAHLGQKLCRTDAERKAWSQNMGHEHVKTTMNSYGPMDTSHQLEIMKGIASQKKGGFNPEALNEFLDAWWEEKKKGI